MQFYYGDKMPLRVLDEIEFWKHQEADHTVVIRQLVQNLEEEFQRALQEWEQSLSQTQATARRFIETYVRSKDQVTPQFHQQLLEFIKFSLNQSQGFIVLVNQIATESVPASKSSAVITVLNHIRRESEYFTGIAQTIFSDT